ncbi:uncharacterized protein cd34 [Mugil cephalus]|uniref:uncharacterized protein cd34 n=1 Tax=Mugil cephalus TaxID=48193 RepID=UPI001FB687F8|nr:uncharacterized protein cd34 [Mugil cephalus]
MATSVWRMNGICRRMAGVLVLCTLLITSEVMCDETTVLDPPTAGPTADISNPDAANPGGTGNPEVSTPISSTGGGGEGPAAASSAAPGDSHISVTIARTGDIPGSQDKEALGTTATSVDTDGKANEVTDSPDESNGIKAVVPEVVCVGKEELPEGSAVKAEVKTTDCEATKQIILDNPAPWCHKDSCNLKMFQEENMVSVVSSDASHNTLASALKSEQLKDKLGVTKTETPPSSSSSVFVGILVTGLLCALAITVGYFKCQRKTEPKGARLAEEAYPADQENQGNTLLSVAPLNPPPETQEKPSVNGESPEAAKTEPAPPPTNGHSTTKTADTEL